MLSIKNLSHRYPGGAAAMRGINLDIPCGMFGLLGPNGAGKSTLMRTIATLQQPSSGEILLDNVDALRKPDAIRRQLGYLPQDFDVYPRGSALELLDHIAVLKGLTETKARRAVVERLLVQTNLFEQRHRRVASFSGGMRQRFGIAQALIGKPRLIIVDEPTAGLDPEERNRFLNLLAEIAEDVVVILSTHIVEDVAGLCPNMAILIGGRVVQSGTPAQLIAPLSGRVWQIKIEKWEQAHFQREHMVLSKHYLAGQIVLRVLAEQAPSERFSPVTAALEDAYFLAVRAAAGAGEAA